MLAAWNREHIAYAGRLGSGPALGPNGTPLKTEMVGKTGPPPTSRRPRPVLASDPCPTVSA